MEPVSSDPDATYAAVHDVDMSNLEPVVVIPPSPANTRDLILSVANDAGSTVKLALAHGSKTVFSRSLLTGATTVKLPALPNATYNVVLDGAPRGTLTIGAKAGP